MYFYQSKPFTRFAKFEIKKSNKPKNKITDGR